MKLIKEVGISIFLWLFAGFNAMSFGLDGGKMKIEPSEPIPLFLQVVIYSVAVAMGLFIAIANMLRGKSALENTLERIFTAESFKVMERRIKPILWIGLFFLIAGLVGIAQAEIHHSPAINRQIMQIPLAIGAGVVVGWMLCKGKTWRERPART